MYVYISYTSLDNKFGPADVAVRRRDGGGSAMREFAIFRAFFFKG